MIPNLRSATLMPIMQRMIVPDSIVSTDSHASDDPLDVSAFHHRRIHPGEGFAAGETHIDGIETVWSQAKRHLRRFNGIPRRRIQPAQHPCAEGAGRAAAAAAPFTDVSARDVRPAPQAATASAPS
jgi:transposase-like protein